MKYLPTPAPEVAIIVLWVFVMLFVGLASIHSSEPETTTITLTIPTASLPRITTAMVGIYPVPMIEDPENPGEMIPAFTENQWAKQCLLHFVRRTVRRYEQKVSDEENAVAEDPDIIQ